MVERIKNKKGFTIIEIMVVIALIGILAAVLVPKFGGVKDTAKGVGMITNVKMVEAYVASQIDNWTTGNALHATNDDLKDAIDEFFTANPLEDPYTGDAGVVNVADDAGTTYSTGDDPGEIYVVINTTGTLTVFINGFDSNGNLIQATRRTVEK
jgi:type IV pilus assembly protein PilA